MPVITEQQVQAQPQYELTEVDKARKEAIALAWQAYEGDLVPPLKRMPDEPDPNVMSNEVQPAVDATVGFLFGEEFEISVDEGSPQAAQDFLDEVWGEKETRIPFLQCVHMNGEASGCAFIRIVPNADKSFRLIEVDPATIDVKTMPQDCKTVLLCCIEYSVQEKYEGKPTAIYYREEISRIDPQQNDPDTKDVMLDTDTTWNIQHWSRIGEKGPWIPAGEPYTWPYPFPPIHACQNLPKPNNFWGYPGVRKSLIGVNNAANFVNSNINLTGKFYGQPILYAVDAGEGTLDVRPGKIIQLPLATSKIEAVNLQSDMANTREFAGDLRGEVEEQTGVPMIATGRTAYMPNGPISGIALKVLFMSTLKRMAKQRCLYGALIINVSKALLVLGGFTEKIGITLHWAEPLPVDSAAQAQEALVKSQLGVSTATLLKELGYNPEEEELLKAEEDAKALEKFAKGQGFPPVPGLAPQEQDEGGQE